MHKYYDIQNLSVYIFIEMDFIQDEMGIRRKFMQNETCFFPPEVIGYSTTKDTARRAPAR